MAKSIEMSENNSFAGFVLSRYTEKDIDISNVFDF